MFAENQDSGARWQGYQVANREPQDCSRADKGHADNQSATEHDFVCSGTQQDRNVSGQSPAVITEAPMASL